MSLYQTLPNGIVNPDDESCSESKPRCGSWRSLDLRQPVWPALTNAAENTDGNGAGCCFGSNSNANSRDSAVGQDAVLALRLRLGRSPGAADWGNSVAIGPSTVASHGSIAIGIQRKQSLGLLLLLAVCPRNHEWYGARGQRQCCRQ